jgi:hypothetical protein
LLKINNSFWRLGMPASDLKAASEPAALEISPAF